jgi:cytochrome c peroxidase
MNLPLERLVGILSGLRGYGELFARAFPQRSITPETIAEAIATHERTLVSGIAPFDAWAEGTEKAISDPARPNFTAFSTQVIDIIWAWSGALSTRLPTRPPAG